jgi:hypothetical protein
MTETTSCEKHKNDLKIDYFHRNRAKLRAFLVQLKLAFAMNKEKYTDQPSKVLLAAAYLRGSAFAWFEPYASDYLENVDADREIDIKLIFSKFNKFEERIKQVFGMYNEERAAARMIH